MLILLSPAKTLDYESPLATHQYTQPELLSQSSLLIDLCRNLRPEQIRQFMSISDKLAHLNAKRFKEWTPDFNLQNARQAILAFKGDVYEGLQAQNFTLSEFDFAQRHVRILSGLYGVLRPLDLMQPYRLEMSTKLTNPKGNDLYAFWQDTLTDKIHQALKDQGDNIVINLASQEYFKALKPQKWPAHIFKPIFLDEKNGKYKMISFYAKKARGMMSRFIIENQLTDKEKLRDFDSAGYQFDPHLSSETDWVFKRSEASISSFRESQKRMDRSNA
ncbi:peroxide stress protein YaaA [Candidatus Williamhamiltonella defendens]|uniref:UPF0246 protein BA171_00160 n=1 Tax=Candidatus Hamiltonella defensa (Bemisia tabaci) TaxID=672795 RepID=A0A249DVR3_9ENTR|nr:peroxide stress protein YaaA [Candidatus Hamiltonella defensa]ASX25643.1 hypothetical protein BA171_00160 [Candidatus Hamiltonella defensa (Bemisia tabaci)]CED79612.1 Conserved hypothetical protein; family UPF0246 [Candidatus Hamiltonella defensa (Bemisia tabaci)]